MSAELDSFLLPRDEFIKLEEKLKEIEQRITVLEKNGIKTHTMGVVSPLSDKFTKNNFEAI